MCYIIVGQLTSIITFFYIISVRIYDFFHRNFAIQKLQ